MLKNTVIYTTLPSNWRIIEGALTAPNGYVWICNNKSRFSKDYKKALLLQG